MQHYTGLNPGSFQFLLLVPCTVGKVASVGKLGNLQCVNANINDSENYSGQKDCLSQS